MVSLGLSYVCVCLSTVVTGRRRLSVPLTNAMAALPRWAAKNPVRRTPHPTAQVGTWHVALTEHGVLRALEIAHWRCAQVFIYMGMAMFSIEQV